MTCLRFSESEATIEEHMHLWKTDRCDEGNEHSKQESDR